VITVTVNTVIDVTHDRTLDDALLEVLRSATSTPTLTYDGAPSRLTGGFWAELVSFRLQDAPVGWDGPLVARVMPDAATAAKETVFQAEVAAQGFSTPAVHLAGGPDDGLGRSFLVMDLASGDPMLSGLGGGGAIAALPRLVRRLPATLAGTMARLHQLDASVIRTRLGEAGVEASTVGDLVDRLHAAATLTGRVDLEAAATWLTEHAPAPAAEVVCHGDLHPFNVLVDADGSVTVLDWSGGLLAPAAYDVAFTGLVLAEPPVTVPRSVRPLVRAAGRALARRFRRAYVSAGGAPIDRAALAWQEGVICLRVLVEVASWVVNGQVDERAGHPWLVTGPAYAARLSRLTGAAVTPR
jgi:aminoglycoside phosphotransferase (APT) family kinase protein